MGMSKLNFFNSILITLFLLMILVTNASAETTFFDQDDAFVMDNFTISSNFTTGGTSGGGCTHNLNCTNCSVCLTSGNQTGNCTDISTCSDTCSSSGIEQNCTYAVAPNVEKEEKITAKETEKISGNEVVDNSKIPLYADFIAILIMGFLSLYLTRDYFKKSIKKKIKA
jgi:hypothetical protein